MKDDAPGTAKSAKLVKAGCGIRFDPETLSEETGFDFDAAKDLLEQVQTAARPTTPETSDDCQQGTEKPAENR